MADRRMFNKKITESDDFLDMPASAQCLYFHLNMSADDDGFVNNPKRIMRTVGAHEDDYKLLLAKSFVLAFDTGVIVIKHWKIHNYIQSDRYHPTMYQEEKSLLQSDRLKGYEYNLKAGEITALPEDVSNTDTECIQDGYNMDTEVRLGKVRLGKDRLDNTGRDNRGSGGKKRQNFQKPTVEEVAAYCQERHNNVDPQKFVDFYESKGWMIGKNHMKDWKAAVRTWEQKEGRKDVDRAWTDSDDPLRRYGLSIHGGSREDSG